MVMKWLLGLKRVAEGWFCLDFDGELMERRHDIDVYGPGAVAPRLAL